MKDKILEYLKNKSILILGFGREGRSTYEFIRKYSNQPLTILDEFKSEKIIDNNLIFKNEKITKDELEKYDLVIKTPGISLKEINTENINITSELELLLMFNKNVIGITGTKGKSTTSSLMYQVINDQNKNSFLLGNIGIPIFNYLDDINEDTILVLELSCHQLEFVTYSPHISVILNLYPEHLDFYKNVDCYYNAKMNIAKYQDCKDYYLYDYNNLELREKSKKYNGIKINKDVIIKDNKVIYNKEVLYDTKNKRKLLGSHNLNNILFVLTISKLLNLDMKKVQDTISNFNPLEHRMELVGTYNNKTYYNDSIATIPESTINCIETIKEVDTLILGGNDRGLDYSKLIEYLNNSNIINIICLPKTGHDMINELNKNTYKVENMEEAVEKAKEVTKKICVLSPAASSYGYFKNFEDRGNQYKELVRRKI